MAKRTSSRSQADDVTTAQPEAGRKRTADRTRETREGGSGNAAGQEQAGAMSNAFVGEERNAISSTSMSSEPSEEDIRLRAYHRYLERGGGHGMDYDDWIEAEKELKNRKS